MTQTETPTAAARAREIAEFAEEFCEGGYYLGGYDKIAARIAAAIEDAAQQATERERTRTKQVVDAARRHIHANHLPSLINTLAELADAIHRLDAIAAGAEGEAG